MTWTAIGRGRLAALVALCAAAGPAAGGEFVGGFEGSYVDVEVPGLIGPLEVQRGSSPEGPWSVLEIRPIGCTQYCYYHDFAVLPGTSYYYRFLIPRQDGSSAVYGPLRVEIPSLAELGFSSNAMPNPFHGRTTIGFRLPPMEASGAPVRFEVLDAQGRRVHSETRTGLSPGAYTFEWSGRNAGGDFVPTGVYFYRIVVGDLSESGRLLYLK